MNNINATLGQFNLFEGSNKKTTVVEKQYFKDQFTFIDLFAGIGGFHLALAELGGKCVFASEWEKNAQKVYSENFDIIPYGDITKEEVKKKIPHNYDVLCAGFPCQAFSIAGKKGGFDDTRGTLFFEVADIISRTKPKSVFLENVKGLKSHDKGRTLKTILNVLKYDLNYKVVEPEILNAKHFGVPQNRERIFIVAFRNDINSNDFQYPAKKNNGITIKSILEKQPVSVKYYLSETYLKSLQNHKERHQSKGNGFGYQILKDDDISNAIVVGGMGRERNLIIDPRLTNFTPITKIKGNVNDEFIRKMTPREWARLQGYPDIFKINVADAVAYKLLGNSVAVPVIKSIGEQIKKIIICQD